jgi:serine/threonine protein kinase/WD40 repeat protein
MTMEASTRLWCPSEGANSVLAEIVEEVTNKFHAGEAVDVEEYSRAHPELAEQLRQLLPALHVLTDLKRCAGSGDAVVPSVPVPVFTAERGELGDFRILREIGRGGMGIVYEAEQISLNRRVALKVLPFAAALDPKQLQRFKNEAQAAAQLHHTNIVPVYGVGCERGVHYYAMQFIDGQTMAALIRELRQLAGLEAAGSSAAATSALANELLSGHWAPVKRTAGKEACPAEDATGPYHPTTPAPLDATPPTEPASTQPSSTSPAFFRTVAHLGVQAAEALEHAHSKGIIHRDIKPANLLIDASGNLWITDFGLARMLSEAGLTMTGDLLGTLRYMSPEQALAKRVPVDQRTDIYSLGVTLYELLALRPAYDGRDRQELMQQIAFEEPRPPRRWNKAIPVELETIVRKAIGKNAAERYGTAQELADDLRRFLDDKPIRAKKPTLLDWTRKWARRHPGIVGTGIAGLLVAVGILAVSTVLILAEYRRTVTALYHSKVREAETVRQARRQGYRAEVWKLLQEAMALETPDRDVTKLRKEAVACMGDFVGFKPRLWPESDFPADINVMALDGSGMQLAVGLSDGTVLLRDLASGVILARQQLPRPVTALAFAPDGTRLVSVQSDGTTQVWECDTNHQWMLARTISPAPVLVGLPCSPAFPFFVPPCVFPRITAITITPDGKQLAACVDGPYLPTTIGLWNLADGTRAPRSFTGQRLERFGRTAFSPDGKFLAAGYYRSKDGTSVPAVNRATSSFGVLVWRRDTGRVEQDLSAGLKWTDHVVFSPDSRLLACPGFWGVALYDTCTFQRQEALLGEATAAVAFTSDSQLLACAGTCQGRVQLWNVDTSRVVAGLQYLNEPRDQHFSVAYSRDLHALVAASRRAVRTWFLAGRGEKLICQGHASDIRSIAFSPDGKLVAGPGEGDTVRLCSAATGQVVKVLPDVGQGGLETLTFSPDGRRLATADMMGTIRIWDIDSTQKLAEPADRRLGRGIKTMAFSPNGRFFAAGGQDKGGVTVWRLQPGDGNRRAGARLVMQAIARPSDRAQVYSLAFSPDSDLLAWVQGEGYHSSNNILHLWDMLNSREQPFPLARLAENLQSVAFHPVSKHLVFVADTDTAETWNVTTSQRVSAFGTGLSKEPDQVPSGPGGTIALSSDGAWLASGHGRFVSIWDMASGQLLLQLPEEESSIMSLAWSPNEGLLAVGTFDGQLAIWNLAKIKAQLDEIGLAW